MARCKRCGVDIGYRPGKKTCYNCHIKWLAKRTEAFSQAENELGTLTNENLKEIQKRVKYIEGRKAKGDA